MSHTSPVSTFHKQYMWNEYSDKSKDSESEKKFKQIQEAYSVLSDEKTRKLYDKYTHSGTSDNTPKYRTNLAKGLQVPFQKWLEKHETGHFFHFAIPKEQPMISSAPSHSYSPYVAPKPERTYTSSDSNSLISKFRNYEI